jgi:hypothetical protein
MLHADLRNGEKGCRSGDVFIIIGLSGKRKRGLCETILDELAKRAFSPPSSLRAQRKTLSF